MPGHSWDVLAGLNPTVPIALAELADAWGPASVPATPRTAASVVLCRSGPSGLETYLLHRHARMAFAPSMAVFPGGGVDPVDLAAEDPVLACARRETEEETGVRLPAEALVRWAHWVTPTPQPIRYDTVFYLAELPVGQEAGDLSTETDHAAWTTPAAAVEAYERGGIAMMPPTLSILVELAGVGSVAEALELGRDRVVDTVLPEVVRDGARWVYRYPRSTTGPTDG